ncbi:MAG: arginine repressor [Lachnospiraceae bacterium]|nr:arginine repressor [Lachnospiraceae bacterium]
MRQKRHEKIIELIEKYDIETQEELVDHLREAGFPATQATVSRDIRSLKLSKVPDRNGRQKYAAVDASGRHLAEKYVGVLREAYVSADCAGNILVIKTVSGMAMAAATALDNLGLPEVVGCIAGDDTIFCAVRTAEAAPLLLEELRKIVEE